MSNQYNLHSLKNKQKLFGSNGAFYTVIEEGQFRAGTELSSIVSSVQVFCCSNTGFIRDDSYWTFGGNS